MTRDLSTTDADDFDPSEYGLEPVPVTMGYSDDPEAWTWETTNEFEFSTTDDAIREMIRAEQERVDKALRGAVMAGYDGLDVNRPPPMDIDSFGIQSIEPWHYPAPDGANGYRTTRYTWDWFSDDELTAICRADDLAEILELIDE